MKELLKQEKALKAIISKGGIVPFKTLVQLRLIRDKIYLMNEMNIKKLGTTKE